MNNLFGIIYWTEQFFGRTLVGMLHELLRFDRITLCMAILVGLVGASVVRYSVNYMAGDPRRTQYLQRMVGTIACVTVIIFANNLLLLAAAWTATSLTLHGLLAFYRDRPVAVAVAHKKFMLARCADVAMVGALISLGTTFHTLRIDHIATQASELHHLPAGAHIGITLVAIAAILKTAQLPFHGWLIQVMEAPTPVSALLHAGVVNLGGFVLLRLAPLVDGTIVARTLLVLVGTTTAVVAALVMTTRVSVKVSLAWSTCAQMGFMLVQCGLGLWEMALLHLLAHSLYKAHSFLRAGDTVRQTQRRRLMATTEPITIGSIAGGAVAATAGLLAIGWAWTALPFTNTPAPALWVMGGVVALAIVPLLTSPLSAVVVPTAYFALHELFARLVPHHGHTPAALLAVFAAAFAGLFVVQSMIAISPTSPMIRRLHPWCFGGFYIDESFTRFAFNIWAPKA
jgi:NAD(P)H-quinone oxidoreductase subunit 5